MCYAARAAVVGATRTSAPRVRRTSEDTRSPRRARRTVVWPRPAALATLRGVQRATRARRAARSSGPRGARSRGASLDGETRWSVMWHLLALTGAREAEILALRWVDVVEERPLRRVRLVAQLHHRTRTREATKTGAVKEVPLHPLLGEVLDRWRVEGWQEEYGRAPTAEDLIVPARGRPGRRGGPSVGVGGPLWQQDVYRALQRDLIACGLPAHRVHDLRHTFASLCADFGVAADVATRWTHAPVEATARHLYLAPSWERQCTEMAKLKITPGRPRPEPSSGGVGFG